MNRKLLCVFLACLSFLALPPLSRGIPSLTPSQIDKPADTQPASPAATELTDEGLNASRTRLEARLAELHQQLLPEAIAALRTTYQGAATPQEMLEWERLTNRLAAILDSHINALVRISNIRKANRDRSVEMARWQGFEEKPPYSIALLDSLEDAITGKQIDQKSLEVMRTTAGGEAEDFAAGLKISRKEVRLAEENAEKNAGKPGESRSQWLLVLARQREAINQAGVVYGEARRLMVAEALEGAQSEINFLRRKLAVAMGKYRFTEQELDQKLQAIDGRREQLRQELDRAGRDVEKARRSLDATEQAVRKAQSELATQPGSKDRLDRILREQERRQILFEAADLRVQLLKGMLLLLKNEKEVWTERFNLAAGLDRQDGQAERRGRQTDLEILSKWKAYVTAKQSALQALVKGQQEKLSAGPLPEAEREALRGILDAYQGQQTLLQRGAEIINEYEQLVLRRNEEAKRAQGGLTPTGRARAAWAAVASLVGKVWYTELYVAEETIIADNQKIVRPRSVTLGKLVEALLILLVGVWGIRHLKKLFHWIAIRRFKLRANDAQLYVRLLTYVMFIGVFVSALVFVNIPLAFFAFFGGALAIGIGFGAQTLINNFISGLILMFDRTIRVGDIVEVDGHRGRVATIGMRSSSIKRFDGVEMLVPNSLFLQQNVTNWTSSDKRVRYSIPVGVAYGSPTRETEQVILKAVEEQPEVLRDPEPYVVFENFADSSLNFTAYFWIELDPAINSLVVFSDIRHRIGERLTEAGIVIPFPQRDLHVAADKPIEIRVIPPE